jgi:hypothetical protein
MPAAGAFNFTERKAERFEQSHAKRADCFHADGMSEICRAALITIID